MEERINDLLKRYKIALQDEISVQLDFEDARDKAEHIKVRVLAAGYESGEISGKNADTRARAELLYLDANDQWAEAEGDALSFSRTIRETAMDRKLVEAEIGLVKAWLYSQAKIG